MGWDAPWHWVILAIIVIALFGYKKLPDASRSLGRSLRIFKTEIKGMSDDDRAREQAREDGKTVPPASAATAVPPAAPAAAAPAAPAPAAQPAIEPAAEDASAAPAAQPQTPVTTPPTPNGTTASERHQEA
jgi:sec-independent protein translocase protein TatA